jgi:hypothetical protein
LQGLLPTPTGYDAPLTGMSVHGQNIFVHCLNEPEGALTR